MLISFASIPKCEGQTDGNAIYLCFAHHTHSRCSSKTATTACYNGKTDIDNQLILLVSTSSYHISPRLTKAPLIQCSTAPASCTKTTVASVNPTRKPNLKHNVHGRELFTGNKHTGCRQLGGLSSRFPAAAATWPPRPYSINFTGL